MEQTSDTVAGLASRSTRARRLFTILGIDYCCAPERPLVDAARAAGVEADELRDLLDPQAVDPAGAGGIDWLAAPLPEITARIIRKHHRHARRLLIDLLDSVDALLSGHPDQREPYRQIRDIVQQLADDLVPHMMKEERFIFPYIDSMFRPVGPDESILIPLFGTIDYPLRAIRHDHSDDATLLESLRELTQNFSTPPGNCDRQRQFTGMLAELHRDLSEHIRVENDVLFPRAVAYEQQLARRGESKAGA
jgi:regulator of cell morphogenesis and NO signaling